VYISASPVTDTTKASPSSCAVLTSNGSSTARRVAATV
jgi:hypothetical protein